MIDYEKALKISKLVSVTNQSTATASKLVLYPAQKDVLKALCEHRKVQILKSRQTGISTVVLFYTMLIMLQEKREVAIVAQDHKTAVKMISDLSSMMSSLDIAHIKVQKNIKLANGSSVEAMTAGSAAAIRGRSYYFVHCTEVAYWPNSIEVWTALNPAINPAIGRVCFESTASAADGIYRRTWDDTKSDFHKIFTKFEDHPNYVQEEDKITNDEWEELQKQYLFTSRKHAAWWYQKYISSARDGPRILREYPIHEAHAWSAASGRWITIDPPVRKYQIHPSHPALKIYEEPRNLDYYVAAIDTATGATEDDYVFVIYNATRNQIAASLATNTQTVSDLIGVIKQQCSTYNTQFLFVESNGPGHATIEMCRMNNIPVYDVWTGSKDKGSYSGMLWVREQIMYNGLAADEKLLDNCRETVVETSASGNVSFDGRKDFLLALSFIGTNKHLWFNQKIQDNTPVDPRLVFRIRKTNNKLGRL